MYAAQIFASKRLNPSNQPPPPQVTREQTEIGNCFGKTLYVYISLSNTYLRCLKLPKVHIFIFNKHVFFIFAFGARDVFRREHIGISSQNGRWRKYFHRRKKICTDNSGTNVLSTGLMVMKYRQEFRKYRMPLPVVFFFFVFLISNKS